MKKSEYKLVEFASTASASKPIRKRPDNDSTNVLSGTDESIDFDELESYEPTEKIELEAAAVKDFIEKKKKNRNYIEFRPDYATH
jgi:hypothetical protein